MFQTINYRDIYIQYSAGGKLYGYKMIEEAKFKFNDIIYISTSISGAKQKINRLFKKDLKND